MARAAHDVVPVMAHGGSARKGRKITTAGPGSTASGGSGSPAAGSAAVADRAAIAFDAAQALRDDADRAARAAMDALRFTGDGVRGLTFERRWTQPGVHPYDEIAWEVRTAAIGTESGKLVFEQKDVEVPAFWSQMATNVVVSKYFRGHLGTPERETSVRQLIDRVVLSITAWAETQHYFATDDDLADVRRGADPSPGPPEDELQLARLVQRRDRGQAAVLGLLHQLRPGLDDQHHGPGQDGGDAVQVRLRRRQQPVHHPLVAGEDGRRRHGQRPGLASCAATTHLPGSSNRAGRPGARPRW